MGKPFVVKFVESYSKSKEGKILVKAKRADIIRRIASNIEPKYRKEIFDSELLLIELFSWDSTEEGIKYWGSIHDAIYDKDYDFLRDCY